MIAPGMNTLDVERHLALINERLPHATPEGAYCLGLFTALVLKNNVAIDGGILDAAMQVKSFTEAFVCSERYLARVERKLSPHRANPH